MENSSKTQFQSRLKPPTPVSSISNLHATSTTKVLHSLNRIRDNFSGVTTTRRVLSRRSKSFSDLRAIGTKPLFDPLGTNKLLGSKSATVKPLLTKSTSTSNLNTQVKKPLLRTGLKTVPEKGVLNRPATTSTVAKTVKRTAGFIEEETKAKVPKTSKPAPYDYKARFNLLSEKHTNLLQVHKELKEKVKETEDDLQQYTVLKEEHAFLKTQYDYVCGKIQELEAQNKHLLKVSQDFEELKTKYNSLQKENLDNVNYIKQLEENKSTLESNLEELTMKHDILTESHQKLEEEHNILKCANELVTQTKKQLECELVSAQTRINNLEVKMYLYKSTVQDHEELRRVMHNQIQDLKGTIRVFCRVRPSKDEEDYKMLCNITYVDEDTLEIKKSKESINHISGKPTDLKQEFIFDKVFCPDATQREIFEELSQLVQSALDGYHICVFAYGQTGSGKTYTMQGDNSEDYAGMIPRTIKLIFYLIKKLNDLGWTYAVEASFLEIYNETVRDLLDPNNKENHEIRFNEGKGTTVTNLTTKTVKSAAELQQLMGVANRNRAVAVTNFNEHSSRSHAVTKITLMGKNEEMKTAYVGSVSLVDLAGSESAKTSSSERITETKNINKSLSTLGTVMAALHNKESHIPYRNSKLTYLLQSSLGGNSKTLMFVNVAPFEECYNESINALRFAAKVKEVKIGSKRNKTYLKRDLSNLSKP